MGDIASSISVNGLVFKKYFEKYVTTMVHDPTLEVQKGLNSARIFRSHFDLTKINKYPVLLFNRSPVRRTQHFYEAGIHDNIIGNQIRYGQHDKYYGVIGTIEYNFLFIANEQRQCEQFEVLYAADRHISSLKKFTVEYTLEKDKDNVRKLGPFEYELLWEDLGEYTYGDSDEFYIAIGGSFFLNGEHIVWVDEVARVLKEINIRGFIGDVNSNELVFKHTIRAPFEE